MASPRIISMDFSTNRRDDCYFRILTGTSLKYITIQAKALDEDSLMDMPLNFQNIIPSLPYHKDDWNSAYISRNTSTGELKPALSRTTLPRVQTVWNSRMVNFLDLKKSKPLSMLAGEYVWEIDTAADETRDQKNHDSQDGSIPVGNPVHRSRDAHVPAPSAITPNFLGHIHEAGRVLWIPCGRLPVD